MAKTLTKEQRKAGHMYTTIQEERSLKEAAHQLPFKNEEKKSKPRPKWRPRSEQSDD